MNKEKALQYLQRFFYAGQREKGRIPPMNSDWAVTYSNTPANNSIKPPASASEPQATALQAAGARERLRRTANRRL
jgi:hypothetical protein